ncbi:hypothetical protein A1QO_00775 [Vibrio genomosp. F10 str. ZF-129]|uniref:Uncharacterized protein n=1 Tax=Vibrio genomosp. F10 str. ZF-129 TaxID=1187848 RepID=A0A1E5BGC6_9VIBR|nr:hypothetical protein [Vibrio genomosp. F10]OEE35326.1 hypothetical protein A1QO_00775 [Vibrio genomosp. F10 str. ZF-129]
MSNNIYFLTSKVTSGISVKFCIENQYQEVIVPSDLLIAKRGTTDLESAEIDVLLQLVDSDVVSKTNSKILTENADAIELYLEEALRGELVLNIEAKYIDESFFDNKTAELILNTQSIEYSSNNTEEDQSQVIESITDHVVFSTLPLATTTKGIMSISDKAIENACDHIEEINCVSDLVKYLGSNTAEWSSKARKDRLGGEERFMQCGKLATLVSFNTEKHMPPVLVYAFEGNESKVYLDTKVKVSNREVTFSADQWMSLFNIAESVDSSLFAEFGFKNVNNLVRKLDASLDKDLLSLPVLNLSLKIDNTGKVLDSLTLIEKGRTLKPKWREPVSTVFGDVVLDKLPAMKLQELWNLDINSTDFLSKFHESMKGKISKSPYLPERLEISCGEYALLVSVKDNELFITDVTLGSDLYDSVSNRFGTFLIKKESASHRSLRKLIAKHLGKLASEIDFSILNDSEVAIKSSSNGHFNIQDHKMAQMLYYPEIKLTLGVKRVGISPLLEIVVVEQDIEPITLNYLGSTITLSNENAIRKLSAISNTTNEGVELEEFLSEILMLDICDHQAVENIQEVVFGDYALNITKINDEYEIVDVRLNSRKFFWICNDRFTYIFERGTKIERALYSIVLNNKASKNFGGARSKLANMEAEMVYGKKGQVSINYKELGVSIKLTHLTDPVIGREPIMAVSSFNKL